MARLVGIDIRANQVRAVLLRTSYRKVAIEQMLEVDLTQVATVEDALRAVAVPLAQHSENMAVSVEGEHAFVHRITLPSTALKQIEEVLPFEVEAQIPVDMDELVYDWRLLSRTTNTEPVVVMTAAARIEHVRARIQQLSAVVGRDPERVGVGPLPLANLAALTPELSGPEPIAIVDLGGSHTEILILRRGEPMYARTLSRGIAGISRDAPEVASALAGELRQSLISWGNTGGAPVAVVHLVGGGAAAAGAEAYLSSELRTPVQQLPNLGFDGATPDQLASIPRFAKAIALAMSLVGRGKDLDLRRGPLAYQRGYGFLKEKVPLLSGLAAGILISFGFATWSEMRVLSADQEVLTKALATLSKNVLEQQTEDPEEAMNLLELAKNREEADPMPHLDAFDVLVEISRAVPMSMTHDIEEFDMQRGHVKVNGVVNNTQDAQQIANTLKEVKCFEDVKISKITQVINSDRQKYVLEMDVKCPEEKKKKKEKTTDDSAEPTE